jgi:hypothetical protein
VTDKTSTGGQTSPETTIRIPGLAVAMALIMLCFSLGVLRGWLNQLPDDTSLPAFVAFDILIVVGLLEAATWLARQHEQIQSGRLPADAPLSIKLRRLNLVITAPFEKN